MLYDVLQNTFSYKTAKARLRVHQEWQSFDEPDRLAVLDIVNPIDGKYKATLSTTVRWKLLPFYDQVALVRLEDPGWGRDLYFLWIEEELIRLNGRSPPIHHVNARQIQLADWNVLDYLRFFCTFIEGEEGPFLTEHESYEGRQDDGRYRCTGLVTYGGAKFRAGFAIAPGGEVEMLWDEQVN